MFRYEITLKKRDNSEIAGLNKAAVDITVFYFPRQHVWKSTTTMGKAKMWLEIYAVYVQSFLSLMFY